MNNENRYDEIAQRSRTRRARDFAFALLLGAVAAFSVGALRGAAAQVTTEAAPEISAASCTLDPAC